MGVSSGDIIINIKEKSLWKVLGIKGELIEAEAVSDVEKTYIKKGFARNITKNEFKDFYQVAQKKS